MQMLGLPCASAKSLKKCTSAAAAAPAAVDDGDGIVVVAGKIQQRAHVLVK
jgi:hypothetical protein